MVDQQPSQTTILQDLLTKAYNLEQEGKTEGNPEYTEVIKQISERDPLNYDYVDKYALTLANAQEGKGGLEAAQEQYEKAIRYNGAQIQLWKKFVEFAVQNHYLVNNDEEKCKWIQNQLK